MEVNGQIHALATLPQQEESLIPHEREASWTPEPVQIFQREKYLVLTRNQTPDFPAHSLVTILTELTWLPAINIKKLI
jgi:hypothetical protein